MKKTTIFFVLFCCVFSLKAQVINIPVDFSTIQAGIDAASSGDTVLVEEDTYIENINFNGKAITVASQFILDGDTSHISRTIIDGSQPTYPDSASVVTFRSGEDTTSVITGFTITGGTGTTIDNGIRRSGGGILIYHSGGKVIHNIIERNHLTAPQGIERFSGGGLLAREGESQAVILRHNIIRHNSIVVVTAEARIFGGGAMLIGGRFLVEHNSILNNTLDSPVYCEGAGMFISNPPWTIEEAIFRNNIVSNNIALNNFNAGYGGGIGLFSEFEHERVIFYNNVISENHVTGGAGGILFMGKNINMIGNTIINNRATVAGNNLGFYGNTKDILILNNIVWTDVENSVPETHFWENSNYFSLHVYYNILKELFGPEDPVTAHGNTYLEPLFETDSYELAETSPAIGRGIDSVLIDETWYVAPIRDFAGNTRPNGIDPFVDLGAFESGYELMLLQNADLVNIGFHNEALTPAFQKDILEYTLSVADTTTSTEALQAIPIDMLADVEINHPVDLASGNEADRTATITVTSSNGSLQKTYTILFSLLSTDASLSALSVGQGTLNPEFDKETTSYTVGLPSGSTETPTVTYTTTDPGANVEVTPAADVTHSFFTNRTTVVKATAEYGLPSIIYKILFNVYGVDIGEESDILMLTLYPNPFGTMATLQLNENMNIHRIELVNMLGETVRVIDHTQGNRVVIERGSLPSGLYFLRIQSDKSHVKKVVVE